MDRTHRIPFWLALVELYSDGYRYSSYGDKQLPFVFDQVVDVVLIRRRERAESTPEHAITMCSDLADALMTNLLFRHKVATHDLLNYAMQHPVEHLRSITTESSTA